MHKDEILDNLMKITHQPFLVFANRVEEKTDNTFETLKLLAKEENVTAGRISEFLDIKPSSVTQIIKKLERAGTVVREKSPSDSRVTIIKITDKGTESLKTHESIGGL
nr:MarR family transcriptional regulator [Pediococcus acidilactici]